MRVLLLSNDAPGYFRVFNAIVEQMLKDGHAVHVAVDSEYSWEQNRIGALGVGSDVFETFFRAFRPAPSGIDTWYRQQNLNLYLVPDFERAEYFGVNKDRSREYYDRLKVGLIAFFEHLISKHKIDLILYESVSNAFAYFAWLVGQRHGANYCGLTSSRIPGRYSIVDGPFTEHQRCADLFHAFTGGERPIPLDASAYASAYVEKFDQVVPDYMAIHKLYETGLLTRYAKWAKVKKAWSLLKYSFGDHRCDFQGGNRAALSLQHVMRNVNRRLRIGKVKRLYESPPEGEAYVLYPLHYHPEASTSVLSPFYIDELNVIRNIAFSLPEGVRLFVKDHVSAYAHPPIAFYETIKRLPNVVLLSPFEPIKELIRKSLAVITLTSTAGYEALVLRKRVFLFGNVFYQFHPDVVRVSGFGELHKLFLTHLFQKTLSTPDDVLSFVASYFLTTYPGTLNFTLGDADSEQLARHIYPHVKEFIQSRPPPDGATKDARRRGGMEARLVLRDEGNK